MSFFEQPAESIRVPERAPLFPLPDCVLFPQMVQPLHVFEARYRAMVAWCLEQERPFVLCTLLPHSQELYDTKRAPIRPLGCLSKISIHKQLPDGRYMLIVRGLNRVEIVSEPESENPFRVGRIQARMDEYPEPARVNRARRREELLQVFFEQFPDLRQNEALGKVLTSELSQGLLCDLLAYCARLSSEQQYAVLSCLDVDRRSDLVLEQLLDLLCRNQPSQRVSRSNRPFPPPFSPN